MVGQDIGKYRVLDRVGRGGMGTVYRAIDETLHREVAIKVLNAELNDPEVARRFRSEAITVARLSHPGIATIYELFQHDGEWLMVMEFLRGETLEHVIGRLGRLAPERAAELCMQGLAALAHAHNMGVVHRDLKPANMMLTHGGDIKIMDFGIARVSGTEHLTNVGFMMGTPAYMAPEQVMGHEIDARADLYAMGVVLYRLITGQLPFKGDSPFAMAQAQVNATPTPVSTLRVGLPAWVDEVLTRALAKAPADRFQSAMEFHDTLQRAVAESSASHVQPDTSGAGGIEAGPIALHDPAGMAPTMGYPPRRDDRDDPPGTMDEAGRPPTAAARALPIAGAAIVVVIIGAWWMLSSGATPPPAVPTAVAAEAPADLVLPAPPVSEPVPAAAVVPAAGPAVTDDVRGGNASAAVAGGAATTDVVEESPPVEVANAKVMVVTDRKAVDQDVTLVFGARDLAAMRDGAGQAAMPYQAMKAATYVYGRTPRWDRSLPGPPDDLDVGGMFRSSRHWLILQGADAYVLLRLEDINIIRVIREVEARTGLTVARPSN